MISKIRKVCLVVIFFSLLLPLMWILSYHEPKFVHVRNVNWIRQTSIHQLKEIPTTLYDSSKNSTISRKYVLYNAKKGDRTLDRGILVVCKTKSSRLARQVQYLLTAQRIKHDLYAISSYLMPDLVDVDDGTMNIGKYNLIIVVDVVSVTSDVTIHDLFKEYCITFGAGLLFIAPGVRGLGGMKEATLGQNLQLNVLPADVHVEHLSIHEKDDFKYLRDGGDMDWGRNASELTTVRPLVVQDASTVKHRLDDGSFNNIALQELISVHYQLKASSQTLSLSLAVIDWNSDDEFVKSFIGLPLVTSIGKLALLEIIHLITGQQGKSVLRFSNKRFIQIDVDDVFFAPTGFNPNEEDIRELISTQELFQQYLTGFKFNLGYCGIRYHGNDDNSAETKGKEELVKNARMFTWFGHTYSHMQPHKLKLQELVEVMKKNKEFALKQGIPLSDTQYSVSPHHSGVYPLYEPLYKAWREVWNITVTSTEQYPHFKPVNTRRGFIHYDIKVLPRQTCGIYTHTNHFKDVRGGRTGLTHLAEEGEVFDSILNNPVSIFMTHYNNYGSDRLALELFKTAFRFINKWTKLELLYGRPVEVARHYFKVFPEDKLPLWTSPCLDKRHMDIWHRRNCSQLPSALIVGPQKTGSTALHFFLKQHPYLVTNSLTKHAFEEVQFFSSEYYYSNGIEWYMSFFPPVNKPLMLFEKSATYFAHPTTPQRVHALNPHTKIIVILADPIRRAYSWYQHMRIHNDHSALQYNFTQVITAHKSNGAPPSLINLRNRCLSPGLYHQHIQKWLEYFQPEQIHFVDGDELIDNPFDVLYHVTGFLNLPAYDYQSILRFSVRKGFYCLKNEHNKEVCLGISKGRHYPNIPISCVHYLSKYYSHSNRQLYRLLLKLSRKSPSWLLRGFSV